MESQNNQGGIPHLPLPKRILINLLRLFFRLLYHQFAWTYDWIASIVSLGAWPNWVSSVLPYIDGPRVLEIGFGPGHLLSQLQAKGITVYGLDESIQMVHIARRRLSKLSPYPSLVRGNAEYLPFTTGSLDQIVMTFPAEFVLKRATLIEIRRVLVEGGNAIALPMAWITGRKPWERFFAWVNRITGEAPEWNERVLEPLKGLGFEVTWKIIDLPSSRLLVIWLSKPSIG